MDQLIRIVYPEKRLVTGDWLLTKARDDIANGLSSDYERPEDISTVAEAIDVLHDTGTVTVPRQ